MTIFFERLTIVFLYRYHGGCPHPVDGPVDGNAVMHILSFLL